MNTITKINKAKQKGEFQNYEYLTKSSKTKTSTLDWRCDLMDLLSKEDKFINEINSKVDQKILQKVKHHYLSVDKTRNSMNLPEMRTMSYHPSDEPIVSTSIVDDAPLVKDKSMLTSLNRKVHFFLLILNIEINDCLKMGKTKIKKVAH